MLELRLRTNLNDLKPIEKEKWIDGMSIGQKPAENLWDFFSKCIRNENGTIEPETKYKFYEGLSVAILMQALAVYFGCREK